MLFLKQMFYKIECQLLCVPYFCMFKGMHIQEQETARLVSLVTCQQHRRVWGDWGVLKMLTEISFEIVIIHTSAIPYDCR